MKFKDLDEVKRYVVGCTNCDLCKTRVNAVPGRGSHKSSVIFVGEAPGRSEDLRGEPFVGSAGKKLDEVLGYAGFSRETLYITNVVKCRPPKNRQPHKEEKDACSDYLRAEIDMVSPKIICILGNTAYWSLLGGGSISKHRGKVVKNKGRLYFLTVHPAAAIYNQDLVKALKEDMEKLKGIVASLEEGRSINVDIEDGS